MYTYLLLDIGTLFFPLLLSFDRKVAFFRKWRALFPAILVTGAIFIVWDVLFTLQGVWSFNPDYLVGISWWGLPLEEWLFFLVVPYACLFIYECLNAYIPTDILRNAARPVSWILVVVLIVIGVLNLGQVYTSVTFLSMAGWLLLNLLFVKPDFLSRFYLGYLVSLLPFFLVNGVLTALPVVLYNDVENLGMRIGTIPVEDSMYLLLLLMMNVNMYEYLKGCQAVSGPELTVRTYANSSKR